MRSDELITGPHPFLEGMCGNTSDHSVSWRCTRTSQSGE